MEKLEQLYEGKAKKVFKTDDPELLIVEYKDDATAFNGLKKGTIAGKGVINNDDLHIDHRHREYLPSVRLRLVLIIPLQSPNQYRMRRR